MKIAIACGGTGGHTFPGLATGRTLLKQGLEVEVLSAGRSIEGATMKGWEGAVFTTDAPKSPLRHPLAVLRSVQTVLKHFRESPPDALLAMGSYASLPPVLAARILRIPVVLHEANAIPGMANVFLSRFASAVAITFPEARNHFPRKKNIVLTGLPVRNELLDQPQMTPFSNAPQNGNDTKTIFVTGGSQGAYAMNKLVAKALLALAARKDAPRFRVIHQTGSYADAEESTRAAYIAAGIEAYVTAFIPQMGSAYKFADLVIARAGAATCAEVALFGLPAVFIPLPSAARNHQMLNAQALVRSGAAVAFDQNTSAPDEIASAIAEILSDQQRRLTMSSASRAFAVPEAATKLAALVKCKIENVKF